MKLLTLVLGVALATAISLRADQTVTTSVSSGQNVVVPDQGKITTSGTVTIQSGGKAVYVGASVTLLPGFTAVSGSLFRATADLNLGNFTDLTDSDLDGLPDAWEYLHFGPGNLSATGTQDSDGDGVSNADEYRAGTDPNLIENTATLPASSLVVLKIPTGKFKKVSSSTWDISPAP